MSDVTRTEDHAEAVNHTEGGSNAPAVSVRLNLTLHTFAFVLGLSAVFIALGFSAGLVSNVLFEYGTIIRVVAGVFLVLMGLLMLKVIPLPFLQRDMRVHMQYKPTGYAGSALVGVAFAAGWTPCIGPILAGILGIAATTGGASQGGLLLGVYALGFAVPFLVFAQLLPAWKALRRYAGVIEKVGAVLLIAVGLLLATGAVNAFAPYLASLGSVEGAVLDGASTPTLGIAFAAGALSFLSPCVLPILPSFLAYLTGMNVNQLMEKAAA
ncbi:MAG: sulfite exporter TauE/SafE family protein [Trueperaceae bacterium]|nr:MAG: sulfite exporter TauE/SafE family protein [Trueperaceae bacterium]UCH27729.1 MAG: sulfite exporter TauE/SafE family protein [Trueperaceae bacterium]